MNNFESDNKISLDIADNIESYLYGWGLPSLIVVINTMSIFLDLQGQYKQRNSTLCISQRGSAKSTLILDILTKSNPNIFQSLPKKMFESELIKNPADFYNQRVLAHDDIIVAFTGTSTKQRQQLVNFFSLLLSEGSYNRQGINHLKNINTIAHFCIAKESYHKFHHELLDSTFFDRFIRYTVMLTREEKKIVLNHIDKLKENNVKLPKIILPFHDNQVSVRLNLTQEMKEERNKLAMDLDDNNIVSFARAQNYIDIFMMSNALLNNRTETTINDLELYKRIHPYHINSCGELKKEELVKKMILEDETHDRIMEKLNIKKSTYYKIYNKLKQRGEIT